MEYLEDDAETCHEKTCETRLETDKDKKSTWK